MSCKQAANGLSETTNEIPGDNYGKRAVNLYKTPKGTDKATETTRQSCAQKSAKTRRCGCSDSR